MTNDQIIADLAVQLYGYDKVREIIDSGEEIPLHSALGWRMRGPYKIKDGAVGIETKLWKMRKVATTSGSGEPDPKPQFYLQKTLLYCKEDVELN